MKKPYTPDQLWSQGFSPSQMLTYLYISMRDGGNGCWESMSKMSKKTGLHRHTISTSINCLRSSGWITEEKGKLFAKTDGKPIENMKRGRKKTVETNTNNHSKLLSKQRQSVVETKTAIVETNTIELSKQIPLTNKGTNKITKQGTDQENGRGISMTGKPLICSQEGYDITVAAVFNSGRARRIQA